MLVDINIVSTILHLPSLPLRLISLRCHHTGIWPCHCCTELHTSAYHLKLGLYCTDLLVATIPAVKTLLLMITRCLKVSSSNHCSMTPDLDAHKLISSKITTIQNLPLYKLVQTLSMKTDHGRPHSQCLQLNLVQKLLPLCQRWLLVGQLGSLLLCYLYI